ncbi:Mucin-associated surface protein (MASP) [Trypanosoma cruzi]|uniref:Mucin-associated surface protein (MASP), putative n=2 Tax=Trypanosoma cruzi TaxID=5693 RepID=Q4E2B3_TRYCC|nr:mucin-associated surface protein (MASP), putative [Trypanosoma cruzi]EAN98912.1 mucin-associated surface protein (MASP), putative [Trypanosoma cruzi]PWV17682.1 Mucin-associated surface protein (MASP) [Trypanosoma cruzi]RNC55293.1 mucin-associated surface protein (MASP) [Trypanosoma cruzi]|eukprot:XP_820763.1 mucin-associated surface protein (MASP) [Trypanosoma cruzi strain CL Brener]
MAMMMTGRVLLVCALCVLWCGAGGRCEAGVGVGAQQDGGKSPPESKGLETSSQGTQDLKGGAADAKENSPPLPTEEDHEDVDDDSEEGDDDDGGTEDEEEEKVRGQSGQEGTVALGSDSTEKKLIGSGKQTELSISSAESISPSGSRELNVNHTQTEFEGKKETDKNTPAVESALTTGNGENTLPAEIVDGNPSPPPPQVGIHSREQDGEGTTSEGQKNDPLPETAATPKSHHDKGSEGTGEDTKATTVTANTTDTTNTQNSDGSTAVSHTTSPLLLLLVVACAAAAAVVAA